MVVHSKRKSIWQNMRLRFGCEMHIYIHFHLHKEPMSDSDKRNIKCNRDKSVRISTNTTLMIVPCMNAVNRIQIFHLSSVIQIDFFVHRTQLTFFESLYINVTQQKPLHTIKIIRRMCEREVSTNRMEQKKIPVYSHSFIAYS